MTNLVNRLAAALIITLIPELAHSGVLIHLYGSDPSNSADVTGVASDLFQNSGDYIFYGPTPTAASKFEYNVNYGSNIGEEIFGDVELTGSAVSGVTGTLTVTNVLPPADTYLAAFPIGSVDTVSLEQIENFNDTALVWTGDITSPIPEPSALPVIGTACTILLITLRRKRDRASA